MATAGGPVLVHFLDFAQLNSVRTLPYVAEWARRYREHGLTTLPEEQRIILILSDIQGLAYEEIAEITNTNLGTVKSRLSRGRARLRDVLKAGELLPARYRHESGG